MKNFLAFIFISSFSVFAQNDIYTKIKSVASNIIRNVDQTILSENELRQIHGQLMLINRKIQGNEIPNPPNPNPPVPAPSFLVASSLLDLLLDQNAYFEITKGIKLQYDPNDAINVEIAGLTVPSHNSCRGQFLRIQSIDFKINPEMCMKINQIALSLGQGYQDRLFIKIDLFNFSVSDFKVISIYSRIDYVTSFYQAPIISVARSVGQLMTSHSSIAVFRGLNAGSYLPAEAVNLEFQFFQGVFHNSCKGQFMDIPGLGRYSISVKLCQQIALISLNQNFENTLVIDLNHNAKSVSGIRVSSNIN